MADENGAEECWICRYALTPPSGGSDACPHRFHFHCIKLWAEECKDNLPTCPQCRLLMAGWQHWVDPEAPQEPDEYLQIPPEEQILFSPLIAGVADPYDNCWLLDDDGRDGLGAELGDPDFGDAGGKQPPQPNEEPGGDEPEPQTPEAAPAPADPSHIGKP